MPPLASLDIPTVSLLRWTHRDTQAVLLCHRTHHHFKSRSLQSAILSGIWKPGLN